MMPFGATVPISCAPVEGLKRKPLIGELEPLYDVANVHAAAWTDKGGGLENGMLEGLSSIIHGFRVQDLFDILIIATLIYFFLIWFKDTASRFVFVGITLLGVIYILAQSFHLYLTTMVFKGFFAILLIALVVIFQEEIRRFFERLAVFGSIGKSLRRNKETSWRKDIDIMVESVADCAEHSTGALIVLQGREPLNRHLQGGYALNGSLSQPLIASIFDKHSIGHDGAVIIHDGLVKRFGCHLPLSMDSSKFGKLGLRHTAALGMSERCDAMCIVVSEERGAISIAHEGKLRRLSSATQLSAILERYYEGTTTSQLQKPASHWLSKNTLEKAVAILLATGLWFMFGYQKEAVQRDFVVPIEYRNISPLWEIEEALAKETTVTIMGSPQAFRLFDATTLTFSVDLSNLREGEQDIVLYRDMIRVPSNLSLVNIQPSTIGITAYELHQIMVPVQVRTTGAVASDLALKGIRVSPQTIGVLAPKRITPDNLKVNTEVVDLTAIRETTEVVVRLNAPPGVRFRNNGESPTARVLIEVEARVPPQTG